MMNDCITPSGEHKTRVNKRFQDEQKALDKKLKGLDFARKYIPKDGACLFRAVSEALFQTQTHYSLLRSQTVAYIGRHADEYSPFIEDLPFDHYLVEMSKENAWGGQLELQALSQIFSVGFHIISQSPNDIEMNTDLFQKRVYLCFAGGNHYDCLYRLNKFTLMQSLQPLSYLVVEKAISRVCSGHHKSKVSLSDSFRNVGMVLWRNEDRQDRIRSQKLAAELQQEDYCNLSGYYRKHNDDQPFLPVKRGRRRKQIVAHDALQIFDYDVKAERVSVNTQPLSRQPFLESPEIESTLFPGLSAGQTSPCVSTESPWAKQRDWEEVFASGVPKADVMEVAGGDNVGAMQSTKSEDVEIGSATRPAVTNESYSERTDGAIDFPVQQDEEDEDESVDDDDGNKKSVEDTKPLQVVTFELCIAHPPDRPNVGLSVQDSLSRRDTVPLAQDNGTDRVAPVFLFGAPSIDSFHHVLNCTSLRILDASAPAVSGMGFGREQGMEIELLDRKRRTQASSERCDTASQIQGSECRREQDSPAVSPYRGGDSAHVYLPSHHVPPSGFGHYPSSPPFNPPYHDALAHPGHQRHPLVTPTAFALPVRHGFHYSNDEARYHHPGQNMLGYGYGDAYSAVMCQHPQHFLEHANNNYRHVNMSPMSLLRTPVPTLASNGTNPIHSTNDNHNYD